LHDLGFLRGDDGRLVPPDLSKETYRAMHLMQRTQKVRENAEFLARIGDWPLIHFANGEDVSPAEISPRLELVNKNTASSDLFRFASLLWRVPVSEGYGRRMRFLVWDANNDKLIGLFALGDAVFNLKVRDEFIGWDHKRRAAALVNMMDAYVLGAVPPYNMLLGGKLVAALIRTREVVDTFAEKYHHTKGVISKKRKHAKLVAISTTSSLGRSSIYNRLKLGGIEYFEPIGYTAGWGHFHIPDRLFNEMRAYLDAVGDKYGQSFKFGNGPNWRMRTIRKTLALLGMDSKLVQHGLPREVFFAKLANNATKILSGEHTRPNYRTLSDVESVSRSAIDRWIVPRALRKPEFLNWRAEQIFEELGRKPLRSSETLAPGIAIAKR
jgi:Domain of unknown function (DUF4338)